MTERKSPMDDLAMQIRRLFESGLTADAGDQLKKSIEEALTAYRPVSNQEFAAQAETLRDLEDRVRELTGRIDALEAKGD